MNESSLTSTVAADDLPTVADYRPLSMLAVAALLGGLASALVLAHPLLTLLPLAAVALAVLALRSLAVAEEPLTGRPLAVAGLCLAMLFLGWGVANRYHHKAVIRASAREFADDWLRVLATGDRHRAHQLHMASEFRADPRSQIKQIYLSNEQAQMSLDNFFRKSVLDAFLAAGPNVRFRFVEITAESQDHLADVVVLKYVFESQGEELPLWLTVRRTFPNTRHSTDWELYAVDDRRPYLD